MKKLTLIILNLIPFFCFSQEKKDNYKNVGVVELGTQGIDVGYSILVGEKSFFNIEAGLGAGSNVNDGSAEYVFSFKNPIPYAKVGYAINYNKKKREEKGKSLKSNSGNFIELQMKYSFGDKNDIDLNKTLLTEIHWGIQRDLGSNIYFRTHIGLGYLYDYDFKEGNLSPTIGVKFGYILF